MKLQATGTKGWFVYQKVVVVFIAFMIPLVAMNIWVNYKEMAFTKKTITDSAVAGASFYANQLDKELYFIRTQQLQFVNDKDLQKLSFQGSTLDEYALFELINQTKDRLSAIQYSSELIVDAGVYVKEIGKTISSIGGISDTPNYESEFIVPLAGLTPKPSFYQKDGRLFFIESENNSGIISYIEISTSRLREALRQITTLYQESEVFLGSKTLGHVLSTAKDQNVIIPLLAQLEEGNKGNANPSRVIDIAGASYFVLTCPVGSLNLSLVMYVDHNEITRPLRQYSFWFYALFVIAIVVLLLYSYSLNIMIHRPLSKLTKAFQMMETDNLNLVIESKTRDEFHYLFHSFNRMAFRLKRSIEENYEHKIAIQQSELKQLQSQINPHFLYNSFFNIYMMCKVGDSDGAAELSQKLGSYYQYITRNGSDEVPLYKEYQHALDYCEIQCIRFSNRIRYEHEEIPDYAKAVTVPRLIIQPIVENVFEHAFEDGMRNGILSMTADYQEGVVRIRVEDNGRLLTDETLQSLQEQLRDESGPQEKTGLMNVNNRLQLKYGAGSGLFVSRSQHGGLRVELMIRTQNERK
ncbi:sensor histidine kinase [Paenibacillus oleatilyticus]|uniref:sensor histidine kinase n=1 Tax=Paenibacillus oleatilyticus TaxID=2594886 RepID=UPI001C1F51A7|nr:histidine kinase [Paenibacillus oleatilyticus]MBU7320247.1 histidine kinase [Paenibacillus oleatilyticus]